MKKNFGRKMAAVTAGVMLMGCFSVNAFAGEAIQATKVQAASIDVEGVGSDTPMAATMMVDQTAIAMEDSVGLTLLQDFEIISETDGVTEIRDKKTGESFFLSFTAEKGENAVQMDGIPYSVVLKK